MSILVRRFDTFRRFLAKGVNGRGLKVIIVHTSAVSIGKYKFYHDMCIRHTFACFDDDFYLFSLSSTAWKLSEDVTN